MGLVLRLRQISSRKLPDLQPRRPTKTSKLEKLLLSEPIRVRLFRIIIDSQSGKPLHKTAKFKITQITVHTYVTDKGNVSQLLTKETFIVKTMFALSLTLSLTFHGQNTLGERLQASGTTSRSAVKRSATRSQPVMLEQ